MKSSQIIAVIIVIVAFSWVASGMLLPKEEASNTLKAEAEESSKEQLAKVRVRAITAEEFTSTVVVTGRTQGERSVDLAAEISAQVVEILKDKGNLTKEGEILAKLEVKDRAAKVKEAKERLDQRKIEYNAAKKLETKGFNSKVRLAQSAADMEEARALLISAQNDLKKVEIKAPFDGTIDNRTVEVGDFVNIGDPLFRIVDLDPLEISGFISEHEVQDIAVGKKAIAKFLNGYEREGIVSFISAEANDQTRTFRIEVSVPNPDLEIKAGFTTELIIDGRNRKAHKISPSGLALNDIGQIGVKALDKNDTVRFYSVEILKDTIDAMWVYGLPENIRLITVGQHFVVEGQKVKPVQAQGDGLL